MLQQIVRCPEHPAEGSQSVSSAGRDAADGQHYLLFGVHHRQRPPKIPLVDVSGNFCRLRHQDHFADVLLRSSDRRSKKLQ